MGKTQLIHRAPDRVADLWRGGELQQLDGDAVAADELGTQSHLELHERPNSSPTVWDSAEANPSASQ